MKWFFAFVFLVSCTDAQFAERGDVGACVDASCTATKLEDGGESVDGSSPASDASAALLGKYAVHTRFYGREQTTGWVELLHELVLIADISRDASGLQMRVETCEDSGHLLTAGLRTNVRLRHPEKFPVRTFGLVVEGQRFHTTGEPLAVGFTPQNPSHCSAGARIASSAPWTDGTCGCELGDAPPAVASDCRVIDPDLDGQPGITIEASGLVNAVQSVRMLDRSQYALGEIDPVSRRHRARFEKDEELRELGCPSGNCTAYRARFCALETQLVTFAPLVETSISCAEVLRRVETNQLFAGEGLDGSFPKGC